jgi:alpha-tubulin suppressor-like RCC1 family protein
MRLCGLLVVLWAACYRAPGSNENCTILCGPTETCPGDLACRGGYCVSGDQVCRPLFRQVAAGTGFACALDDTGARWCWGSNAHHQVSPATDLQFSYANREDQDRNWQVLDAGGEHACGIADGHLYCWGQNDRGQVSDQVSGDVSDPLEITFSGAPSAWTAVAAGSQITCAIGDRKLWCWGLNGRGQLGDGTMTDRGAPTLVGGGIDDWIGVATAYQHTCGISATRGVFCWGDNTYGQIGSGATNPQLTPNQVLTAASTPLLATSIAVSNDSACASTTDGNLMCWGNNGGGELGESQIGTGQTSVPLSATMTAGWTQLQGARNYFCGIRGTETVCWGASRFGGLGNGFWNQNAGDHAFAAVMGTTGTTQISVGWDTNNQDIALSCALVGTDVLCWGDNRFGQLAAGPPTMSLTPHEVSGDHTWADLQVGYDHACGVDGDKLYCWGSTELGAASGQFSGGQGSRACDKTLDCDVPAPKELGFFTATPTTRVALGTAHSCAFHEGKVTCWGDNRSNQLGGTATPAPRQRDITAPGGASWTSLIQTGRYAQCAKYRVGATDATACWGNILGPRTGIMMMGPPFDAQTGIAIGSNTGGALFDCILDSTSTLQCMGDNNVYEYGDNTMTSQTNLTSTGRTYTAIATNTNSPTMCGIQPDTQIACWGANERGQTGSLTTSSPTMTPNVVTGLTGCTAVTVGREHACAICGGAVSCWGDNRVGELGTGSLDRDPAALPRMVSGAPAAGSWVQIAAGAHFTCVRSDQGLVECWGFSPHSGLGNGSLSANLPVVVQATPAR